MLKSSFTHELLRVITIEPGEKNTFAGQFNLCEKRHKMIVVIEEQWSRWGILST